MAKVPVVEIPQTFEVLFKPKRYKVFFGGRGSAKSWSYAMALVILGVQKPMRILCTREFQKSIKESVHRLLADSIERCGLQAEYEVLDKSIRGRNGTLFIFEGLRNNPNEIKSLEGIDVCWCEEAQAISSSSWKFLIPTIRKEGSEIWVSFNPLSEFDSTYQRFVIPFAEIVEAHDWKAGEKGEPYIDERHYIHKVSWRDNPFFTSVLRDEKDADFAKDEAKAAHVWEGECADAAEGAILAEQLRRMAKEGRITNIPIVNAPVYTAWDLGRNDTTCIIWFQDVAGQIRIVDFYEDRLKQIPFYCKVVKEWADERDAVYERHYMPHDVEAEVLGMQDTREQQFEAGGVKPLEIVPKTPSIEDGIAALRGRFPEFWIDKERCADLLKACRMYQYEKDERLSTEERPVFKDKPGPKWATNPVDALRQIAQGYEVYPEMPPMDDWEAASVA